MDARTQFLNNLLGKAVHVVVDRPIGYCHKGTVYPVNYGYIPGLMGGDGEEQDAYILGIDTPLSSFDGQVVGAIRRKNDVEDKLIVAPEGMVLHQGQIAEAVHFVEQYFDSYILSLFRKSCGVLPYRVVNSEREYLIVFEAFSHCWSLPKGHMEAGETEVETALREVDRGIIEATQSMGATTRQIITRALLPEARPGIIAAVTVIAITLVSYTAMAGVVGGGGLGDLAIRYGYQRFQTDVMVVTVVLLLVLVQILQSIGDRLVVHYSRK